MRFSGRDQQKGVRRPAVAARWLVDGSVPARGRRAWAWARRSMAGIGLPVSPERRECRQSASALPPASVCPGQDGGAAARGLSGVLARSGRRAAAALLLPVAALLALPLQAQAQTEITLVRNTGQTTTSASAEARSPVLFSAVTHPPAASRPPAARALRSRVVTMDLEQVRPGHTKDAAPSTRSSSSVPAPGATLTLNLFDDVVVTARVERTAPTFSGGYSVSGHLLEEPLGTLTLVVNGETVSGTVRLPAETYQIRSMGDGLYAISEVEEPPFNCGVEGPHAEADHSH